jgi:hypothetical protein
VKVELSFGIMINDLVLTLCIIACSITVTNVDLTSMNSIGVLAHYLLVLHIETKFNAIDCCIK